MRLRTALTAAALASAFAVPAVQAQLVSTPNPSPGGIGTPFAGPTGAPGTNPGTVYQQIYNATNFSGPTSFNQIRFFQSSVGGTLRPGDYSVFVSTSTRSVIGANRLTTDFDSNRGLDNMLFGVFTLGGTAMATLDLTGTTFNYDPTQGNLLLDFRIANGGPRPAQPAFFAGQNTFAGGSVFSSASNFTSQTGVVLNSQGLFTEFRSVAPNVVPEPSTYMLLGTGLLAIAGVMHRRRSSISPR